MGIIRLLLALAVVTEHGGAAFGLRIVPGTAAVQCFYVISGFYMQLVLSTAYPAGLSGTLRFYSSRYLRLAPSYLLVVALTLAGAVVTHKTFYMPLSEFVSWLGRMTAGSLSFLVFTNVAMFGQDIAMFLGLSPTGSLYWTSHFATEPLAAHKFLLVPQAWSLGVELAFYLIAPALLRARTQTLVAVGALSFAIRLTLAFYGLTKDPWNYRFFPSELGIFVLGALAYRTGVAFREKLSERRGKIALGAIFLICLSFHYIPVSSEVKRFFLVFLVSLSLPDLFHLTRRNSLDQTLGKLSYPIYISHLMLLGITKYAGQYRAEALVFLSIAFAYFTVRLVEDPIDSIRRRLKEKASEVRIKPAQADL